MPGLRERFQLDMNNISFPTPVDQLDRFERQNPTMDKELVIDDTTIIRDGNTLMVIKANDVIITENKILWSRRTNA